MTADIKTGISAWTDKSLLESGWYPKDAKDPAGRLRFYAERFRLAESDSTYYALPAPHVAELWSERTPEGFTMDVKAFALLTGHYTDPKRLPHDLFEALEPAAAEKARLYPKDVPAEVLSEIARRFRIALEPLHASGKLGVVLFQYPPWFPISRDNKAAIVRAKELFPDYQIAVEFRNATWLSDRNQRETLDLLRAHGLVFTCVDGPQGFPSSVPPIAATTSDVAVVRFHGRNAVSWQKAAQTARERFEYRYSVDELREWVPKIESLGREAREVHVVMNNCYGNYSVTNARQITELLEQRGGDLSPQAS